MQGMHKPFCKLHQMLVWFLQLGSRLAQAIEVQIAATGSDDPDWQRNHLPRILALRQAGWPELANQLQSQQTVVAAHDEQLGGRKALAELIGWKVVPARAELRATSNDVSIL